MISAPVEGKLLPGPWGLRDTGTPLTPINGEACTDASRTKRGAIVICHAQMLNRAIGYRTRCGLAGRVRQGGSVGRAVAHCREIDLGRQLICGKRRPSTIEAVPARLRQRSAPVPAPGALGTVPKHIARGLSAPPDDQRRQCRRCPAQALNVEAIYPYNQHACLRIS